MSLRGEPRVLLPALPPGSAAAPCPDDTRKGSVDGEGDGSKLVRGLRCGEVFICWTKLVHRLRCGNVFIFWSKLVDRLRCR